jgi:ribosomal-protein-alanine N-acetyltransferase
MTVNADRFKRFFPKTLEQNLTPDLATYFVQQKVRQFKKKEEFLFVLKELESRTIIGLVYIKDLNWNKRQAELAYCIGYQYEGKGHTSQSVQTLSGYAFDELGLKTLRIIVHKSNQASIRVAEKCSYIWKKTLLKAHTPPNENPLDMELYELEYER